MSAEADTGRGWLGRAADSDLGYSFRRSRVTVVAAAVSLVMMAGALFAGWIAPQNPFDLASLDLFDAFTPPAWHDDASARAR